jgi:VWFA-related protein
MDVWLNVQPWGVIMKNSRLVFALVLLSLCFAVSSNGITTVKAGAADAKPGKAITAAAAQGPVFRLEVRRVPLDVVVTDKQGNPVRGLRKEDFVVKEDGKTQRVLSFDFEDGSKTTFVPTQLPPPPANTFVNIPTTPERGPLYVLYYDMVNTSRENQMNFRRQLLEFVDHAAEGTRMALFANVAGLHMLQGFTSDHALLRAAIESTGPGPHLPKVFLYGDIYGSEDSGAALSNLRFLAEYLGGIPGRKNLLWMADNFPIPVGPRLLGSLTPTHSGGSEVLDLSELQREMMQHTYAAMMRSQVAVYPINLSGVIGPPDGDIVMRGGGDAVTNFDYQDVIASATGGRAFHGDNKLDALLDKAVEHGSIYYSLTYSPTNIKYDGGQRNIQVTLAKKSGYTLNYRTIYYGVPDDEKQPAHKSDQLQARFVAAKTEDTFYANIEHGAPMLHDLLFSAHVSIDGQPAMATAEQMLQLEDSPAFFRTRKKNHTLKPLTPVKIQKYVIDYGVMDAQLKPTARIKGASPTLEFAAAAYDADGRLLNSMLNEGQASGAAELNARPDAKPDAKSGALFHAAQELDVPPGAAFIRLAVRDKLNNRTGTLEIHLPLKQEPAKLASKTD